jgi:hypothetical protein
MMNDVNHAKEDEVVAINGRVLFNAIHRPINQPKGAIAIAAIEVLW